MIWDFAAILTMLVFASGFIWLTDAVFFAPKRAALLSGQGDAEGGARLPVLVDYAKSFFPVFLIVLLLRSFLVEPFRIPSGSMIPTLLVGDFILVNKFAYGIRLPVLNQKVIAIGEPERGDVVVFRYPLDPSTPFIKRIVGLPGDVVTYRNKRVLINGVEVALRPSGTFIGVRSAAPQTGAEQFREKLGEREHELLITPGARTLDGVFTVPDGHYFVLGDNRDNSRDSRFWGFVPDANLVGKAFYIWFNWDHGPVFSRIGSIYE